MFEDGGKHVGDEINTFLHRPPANEDKELSIRLLLQASPLLGLTTKLSAGCLETRVHLDLFGLRRRLQLRGPFSSIAWIGIR